jgi:hypothetical protein
MDPYISRLALARQVIDEELGEGYAAQHPELLATIVASAASDRHARHLADAIDRLAAALVQEAEPQPLVRAAPGINLIR